MLALWVMRRRQRQAGQQLRQGRLTMQLSRELSPADLANVSAFSPSVAASSLAPNGPAGKRATRGSMLMPRFWVHVHGDGQAAEPGAFGDQAAGTAGAAGSAAKHSIANSFLPPNPSVLPPAELAQLDELAAAGDPEAEALAVLASELYRQEQLLMQELALLHAAEQQGVAGTHQQAQLGSRPSLPAAGEKAALSPSAPTLDQPAAGQEEFHTPGAPHLASPSATPSSHAFAMAAAPPESSLAGSMPGDPRSPAGAGSVAGSPSPHGTGGLSQQTLASQPPTASSRHSSSAIPPTMPPWLDEGASQVPLQRVSSALRRLVGGLPAPLPLSRLSGASVAAGSGRLSRALPSVAEAAPQGASGDGPWAHAPYPPVWQRNHANPSAASSEGVETVRLRRLSSALRRLVSTKLKARDLGHLAEPSEQGEPLPAEHLPSGWASELTPKQ